MKALTKVDSLQEFIDGVKTIEENSGAYLLRGSQVGFENTGDHYRLEMNDGAYTITDHGLTQFLAQLGIPKSYFDKLPPVLQQSNIRYWLDNKEVFTYKTYTDKDSDEKFLIGVGTSAERQLSNVTMIEAFADSLESFDKDVEIRNCYLDPFQMQLRGIVPSTKREVANPGDIYSYGFHLQLSEVRMCPVIVSPLVYRLVCSNGMIDTQMQNKLLKQRSISIARDALKIVFEDMFKWIEEDKSSDIFNALQTLRDIDTKYNRATVEKLLSKACAKLRADFAETFISNVSQQLPPGLMESPKVSVDGYDFYQMLTNSAQKLPIHLQTQVERNVTEALLGK